MKKLTNIAIALGGMALMASCSSKTQSIAPQSSVAIFDSFSYEGDDDFYKINPLQQPGAYYNPILAGWYSDPSICTNGKGDSSL